MIQRQSATDPSERRRIEQLLGYWRAIEVLGHFALPLADRPGLDTPPYESVSTVRVDSDLPWNVQVDPPPREWLAWHIVYLGVHRYDEAARQIVVRITASKRSTSVAPPEPIRSSDMCCVASFVCDATGIPVPGSLVLAGHAWAIGSIATDRRLDGYDAAAARISSGFDARQEVVAAPTSVDGLAADLTSIVAATGWRPPAPANGEIARVKRVWRWRRDRPRDGEQRPPDSDMLTSFYRDDLRRVHRTAANPASLPAGLRTYLSGSARADRVDITRDRTALEAAVSIERVPAGRWPQPDGAHLVLMQQVAVNRALGTETGSSGLFSVNGPPGTGKTTLLRDIVAAIIVERATKLAVIIRPAAAFTGTGTMRMMQRSRRVHRLDASLRGFEIVVASSNNAAVENITRQLPAAAAIDPGLVGDGDPLARHGAKLLAMRATPDAGTAPAASDDPPAWALLTGILGNRENRRDFVNALWYPPLGTLREELAQGLDPDAWSAARQEFRLAIETEVYLREKVMLLVRRDPNAADGDSATPVDDSFWSLDETGQQTSLPWISARHNRARGRLLAAALRLHRSFVLAAGKPALDNLDAAMDAINSPPADPDGDLLASVWSTLFLVVPVISTTFASVGRMLRGLGPGSIGWLLTDEAGQAAPQQAAGAVWRSRRTIVIGDPQQIPPVETAAPAVLDALREEWQVPIQWQSGVASVQTAADIANPLGAVIGTAWVGCPLRVHRRCQEPMFSVTNDIAYGGLMVQATPPAYSRIGEVLGESRWITIAAVPGGGHWVPAQGEMLGRMLRRLLRTHILEDIDLFVISPFRTVAYAARDVVGRLDDTDPRRLRRWARDHVGTIHTVQGREADAVILLLGGDPAVPGALHWASAQPNILNVAVSRAKNRLYVVGDAAAWSTQRHFSDLHARLRVVEPRS